MRGVLSNDTQDHLVGPGSIGFFVLQTLPIWKGYTYSIGGALDYPRGTRGVPSSMVDTGTKVTNCVGMTWATLCRLYPETEFDRVWYEGHMIYAGRSHYAGLDAAHARGIAEKPKVRLPQERGWYLAQAWTREYTSGHSFFIWVGKDGERWRFLESSGAPSGWGAVHWTDIGPADTSEDPGRWLNLLEANEFVSRWKHLRTVRLV